MKLPADYPERLLADERYKAAEVARSLANGRIPGRRCEVCNQRDKRLVYSRTRQYSRSPEDLIHEYKVCESCWWRPTYGHAPYVNDLAERQGWTCQLCHEPIDPGLYWPDMRAVTVDHVVSRSRGGSDDPSNLQLTHHICNSRKGNRLESELGDVRWEGVAP